VIYKVTTVDKCI